MKQDDYLPIVERLTQLTPGGYDTTGPAASEPVAWATLALAGATRNGAARRAGDWLAAIQQTSGAVGVCEEQPTPAWPTSLAILAWRMLDPAHYRNPLERAIAWSLHARGSTMEPRAEIGHDPTLVGWSWAADTHSWLEPTAMFVAALRAAGHGGHARVRQGVRLLANRLLPSGGCNYGNTLVLGQELLPHIQPTGLVLWALTGEPAERELVDKAIDYLHRVVDQRTATQSLAFALLGLAAQGAAHPQGSRLLNAAARRELAKPQPSPYKLALLAIAARPDLTGVAALKPYCPVANA